VQVSLPYCFNICLTFISSTVIQNISEEILFFDDRPTLEAYPFCSSIIPVTVAQLVTVDGIDKIKPSWLHILQLTHPLWI